MALRGKSPETVEKRLKAFFFGESGTGKTTTAINFPKPYVIDTEKGAENEEYTDAIKANGGYILRITDFDDLLYEVKELLTEKHPFKTLVIDPLTTVYNNLVDDCELKFGTEFGKHIGEANKKMRRLIRALYNLDMNVIITSHSKNEYGNNMTVLGKTFDCYKKLDYVFDLVFQFEKRGKEKYARVTKSRVKGFIENDSFKVSYAEIAKRYDSPMLEKDCIPVNLATEEQLKEVNRLLSIINISKDIMDKWLTKCEAETINDVNSEHMQKFIDHLKAKVSGESHE